MSAAGTTYALNEDDLHRMARKRRLHAQAAQFLLRIDLTLSRGDGTDPDPPNAEMELWLADLVCPVEGAPIRRGALLTASGRVLAVGDEAFVRPSIPVAEERDFGRAILIPGLVNAHTHLELSGIERESGPMEEWIVSLVREVRGWPAHLFLASARIGVAASLAAGVTCVGDVSISGESATAIAGGGCAVWCSRGAGARPGAADDILAQKLKDQALFPEYKEPYRTRFGMA